MSVQQELSERFNSPANTEYSVILIDGPTEQELGVFTETINNPFELDLRKFVPATGNIDLTGLYELASKTISWKQTLEGVAEDQQVQLVKDWNPRNFWESSDSERITCRLIKREPAKMSAGRDKFTQRRSRWDREFVSASTPAHTVTILSQPMDHTLEFVCWAKDSRRADERALWLERLFVDHSWIFLSEGVDRWYFEGRLSDIVVVQGDHVYHQRPLRFFARLRELEALFEPQIRSFSLSASISD